MRTDTSGIANRTYTSTNFIYSQMYVTLKCMQYAAITCRIPDWNWKVYYEPDVLHTKYKEERNRNKTCNLKHNSYSYRFSWPFENQLLKVICLLFFFKQGVKGDIPSLIWVPLQKFISTCNNISATCISLLFN